MTRNQRRAQLRRDAVLPTVQVSEPRIPSRKIKSHEIPALMQGPARPMPRRTYKTRAGVMGTSPYYWNFTTIDSRWDK